MIVNHGVGSLPREFVTKNKTLYIIHLLRVPPWQLQRMEEGSAFNSPQILGVTKVRSLVSLLIQLMVPTPSQSIYRKKPQISLSKVLFKNCNDCAGLILCTLHP